LGNDSGKIKPKGILTERLELRGGEGMSERANILLDFPKSLQNKLNEIGKERGKSVNFLIVEAVESQLESENAALKAEVERLRELLIQAIMMPSPTIPEGAEAYFTAEDYEKMKIIAGEWALQVDEMIQEKARKMTDTIPRKILADLEGLILSPVFSSESYVEWWDIVDVFAKHGIEIDGE
jgi:hypothetical protein